MKFMENPIKTISLNTTTTCMLFEKLKPFGRFLYISSSEIYEGSCILPYKEEDIGRTTPHHTRSCYIEGKRCGEAICSQYNRNGYCAKIARLSLAYGPGTRTNDTRAINSFIRQGLSGEITLLDDGAALRTYCYIADAIEIIMNILINGNDCVYNVGGESRTSIAGLAKLIGNIMNVPVNIPETSKFLRGAPQDVMLDLTKIKTEFNKTSFVPLETGLVNTIAWQRDLYKQEGL
jgi:nucleoside-diphosphate-sugar epimerase